MAGLLILFATPASAALAPKATQINSWLEQRISYYRNAQVPASCDAKVVTSDVIDAWKNLQGYEQSRREWRLYTYKNFCQIRDITQLRDRFAELVRTAAQSGKGCLPSGLVEIENDIDEAKFLLTWLQQIGDWSPLEEQRLFAEHTHPINKRLDADADGLSKQWHDFHFAEPQYYSEATCNTAQFTVLATAMRQLFKNIEAAVLVGGQLEAKLASFFNAKRQAEVLVAGATTQVNAQSAWLSKNATSANNELLTVGTPSGLNLLLSRDDAARGEELWRRALTAELRSQPAFCAQQYRHTTTAQRNYSTLRECEFDARQLADDEHNARLFYQNLLLDAVEISEQTGQLLDAAAAYSPPLTAAANRHLENIHTATATIKSNHAGF